MRFVLISAALFFLSVTAVAGPGETVDVRVFDRHSGELLAESSVGLEQRLMLDAAPEEQRYLGLRRALFRGNEVLEISLASQPELWQSLGYTTWNQPSVNSYGAVRIQTIPVGWAERFCQGFDAIPLPAERDPSVSLTVNGQMHLSRPGWRGTGEVDLLVIGESQTEPQWQARIDADDQLYLRERGDETWQSIGAVRDDHFMVRQLAMPAGPVGFNYTPASYASRFCDRYRDGGEAYAQMIADYVLGMR